MWGTCLKILKNRANNVIFRGTVHTGAKQMTEVIETDGIREIILVDTKTRNSLSMDMMDSILCNLKYNQSDKNLRCIVLSANGNIWSAGHNLKDLNNGSVTYQHEVFSKLTELILSIYTAPVPIIAKVNGLAAAAGCQLAASCDILLCSDKSTFSTPGANFGVFCSTPGVAIARTMPRLQSSYMLFTGLPITAEEAYITGLVSRVVPEQELDDEMKKITTAIMSKSRAVIALGKDFYYKQIAMGIKDAYHAGANKMTENLGISDGREGLQSFVEKKKPKWTHE